MFRKAFRLQSGFEFAVTLVLENLLQKCGSISSKSTSACVQMELASSLQKLGITLVQRMGARKLAAALPVVGAVAGGVVNARFVGQLAEAAEMVFAARRLQGQGEVKLLVKPRRRALNQQESRPKA